MIDFYIRQYRTQRRFHPVGVSMPKTDVTRLLKERWREIPQGRRLRLRREVLLDSALFFIKTAIFILTLKYFASAYGKPIHWEMWPQNETFRWLKQQWSELAVEERTEFLRGVLSNIAFIFWYWLSFSRRFTLLTQLPTTEPLNNETIPGT